MNAIMKISISSALIILLAACGSTPKSPDWQLEAKGSIERANAAYLEGNARIDAAELARARSQLSRTGRADLLATAELLHCATRVASLQMPTNSRIAVNFMRSAMAPTISAGVMMANIN